jgi:cation diffusion facilitator family transporter
VKQHIRPAITAQKASFPFAVKLLSNMDPITREHQIYRVTLLGSAVNLALVVFKLIAGIIGSSAAMIADGVHSLSDLLTDFVVLVFVKISNKPQDKDHDYGHGKYETLGTAIIGAALMCVGAWICLSGLIKIYNVCNGAVLPSPGKIALAAAVISILMKEWAYRFTVKTGKEVNSQAVIANAWHHRSDALSSIGTALGIGGAILLGDRWTILDPVAAVCVSFFIIRTAYRLMCQTVGDLLEKSLPEDVEDEIIRLCNEEPEVSEVHHLRTRRIGNQLAIDMHVRMPGGISLYRSHQHATHIEERLRKRFGNSTYINLHVEPVKINGVYQAPDEPQYT